MKELLMIAGLVALLGGLGYVIGKASGRPVSPVLLIVAALFGPPLALGLFLGGQQAGKRPAPSAPARPLADGVERLTFRLPAYGETTGGQWAYFAGGPVVGALVFGVALGGGWAILGGMLGLLVGGGLAVVDAKGKPQVMVTTLETDGVTLWAFNERAPDVQKKGRCQLWAVPLDQAGAFESGNAYQMFGANWWLGALRVLQEVPVGDERRRAMEAAQRKESVAVFLRGLSALLPLYAHNITNDLAFQVVNEANSFLASARAMLSAAPDPAASPSAAPSGFDL